MEKKEQNQEIYATLSLLRNDFKYDGLTLIQRYADAFAEFYACYEESDEAVEAFLSELWAETCKKFDLDPEDIPMDLGVMRKHFGDEGSAGYNVVLGLLPRAISYYSNMPNMFIICFEDITDPESVVPPRIFIGEHGSKRGNDDKLWTVEMEAIEEDGVLKAHRRLHGRFEDCEISGEPEAFYNRVLDIICDGENPEAVTEVTYS